MGLVAILELQIPRGGWDGCWRVFRREYSGFPSKGQGFSLFHCEAVYGKLPICCCFDPSPPIALSPQEDMKYQKAEIFLP